MGQCTKCRDGLLERFVKPEHTEDLGGIVVKLKDAVKVRRCTNCGAEETAIPDMQGLVRAVALARALCPIRLAGREVRFMRRVLDMTQKQFGVVMELSPETVSRWENDVPGIGGMTEKLMRHNVCALLYKAVWARAYDPADIAKMKMTGGEVLDIEMRLVRVKHNSEHVDAWDDPNTATAA